MRFKVLFSLYLHMQFYTYFDVYPQFDIRFLYLLNLPDVIVARLRKERRLTPVTADLTLFVSIKRGARLPVLLSSSRLLHCELSFGTG